MSNHDESLKSECPRVGATNKEGQMSNPNKSGRGNGSDGSANASVATRFKPGQSGNPKGRPKGSKNLATLLTEALDEQVTVLKGECKRVITKLEAVVHSIINGAMNGNPKHIAALLQISGEGVSEPPQSGVLIVPVTSATAEEWEAVHGAAARGKPPPDDVERYMNPLRWKKKQEEEKNRKPS
jgi:hypothetical protein